MPISPPILVQNTHDLRLGLPEFCTYSGAANKMPDLSNAKGQPENMGNEFC
jgi:hypothetical protein